MVAKKLNVPIKVIGNAGPLKSLIEKFKEKGVKVKHLGLLPRQELFDHMRRADVFVYPFYIDAYPLTLAETISIGVPTVTYRNPGYSWIYKEVLPLVRLGDVNRLTEVTKQVLQDPSCVLSNYEKWNIPEFARSWDGVLKGEVEVTKKWLNATL